MVETDSRSLAHLPKAHNQIHLDGAMRRETLIELSAARGLKVPEISGYGSFQHFADTIAAVQTHLTTPDVVQRLVTEAVDDAFLDGAVWIELSVWPGALSEALGSPRRRIEIVLEAGRQAANRVAIGFGLMLAANRDRGPAEALDVARLAASLREDGVVSFGLDGDESGSAPELFADSFAVARAGGLLATPHAGELAGPASVRGAIDHLQADRILHGIRAVEDRSLLQELAQREICLDVCPSSNVMLSVVPSLEAHPLKQLLREGIPCSLNADDPLLFGTTLLQEYQLASNALGLDASDLAAIARSSIRFSGAPQDVKLAALARVDFWLASVEPGQPDRRGSSGGD